MQQNAQIADAHSLTTHKRSGALGTTDPLDIAKRLVHRIGQEIRPRSRKRGRTRKAGCAAFVLYSALLCSTLLYSTLLHSTFENPMCPM